MIAIFVCRLPPPTLTPEGDNDNNDDDIDNFFDGKDVDLQQQSDSFKKSIRKQKTRRKP